MSDSLTGGCQCGAVRFRAERLGRGSICHCRMCQKQFGAFYGPLITAFDVNWTRGQVKWFRSSNKAERGFCADCGTPLTYRVDDSEPNETELAIGAFDNPVLAAPSIQVNLADKLAFTDGLPAMPAVRSDKQQAFNTTVVSYQHPDHDTAEWPPAGGFHG